MPIELYLTLAEFEEVMRVVVPILFMVLYGIGQLVAGREAAKKKKLQQPRQPPAGGGPPNQADALRGEVEQFLRRAKGQADPPREQPAPPVRSIGQRPAKRPTKQRLAQQRKLPSQQARPAPQQPAAHEMRNEGVAEHVARHLDSSDLTEHSDRLGQVISQTDERLESRIRAKFDHQLGSLRHKSVEKKEQTSAAHDLFDILSSPEGMRQAILMHEIIRRPVDRWQ